MTLSAPLLWIFSKMTTIQEEAQCVLSLTEFKSVMTVQRNVGVFNRRTHLLLTALNDGTNSIKRTEVVKKSHGRPKTSDENVELIR